MKRLLATAAIDARIQLRNGFYLASGLLVLFYVLVLHRIPEHYLTELAAVWVFGNLMVNTFYFNAGLILLERAEGSLLAISVTPLRSREYILARVLTLTLLGVLENAIILVLVLGLDFRIGWLLAGCTLGSVIYCLLGIVSVSRYETVNEYLFPSFVWALVLSLPYLWYFDLWSDHLHWLHWLHPLQGSMVVLKASMLPVSATEVGAALLLSTAWMAVCAILASRALRRVAFSGLRVRERSASA